MEDDIWLFPDRFLKKGNECAVKKIFSYEYTEDGNLIINISYNIKYDFTFLNCVTELIEEVENGSYKKITISSKHIDVHCSEMSAAYLFNVLAHLPVTNKLYLSPIFFGTFKNAVYKEGGEFTEININNPVNSRQNYIFTEESAAGNAVQILVDFIAELNYVLDDAKEFLNTTIGEIFSNAFLHGDENKVYFMYDIEWSDRVQLVINITDFGKTIVSNVQNYFGNMNRIIPTDNECIEWAMKSGNTTREGSGGYGLPTLVDYIEKINGELLIFSGKSIYALKGMTDHILNSKGYFFGTSISLKIALFDMSKVISYDKQSMRLISVGLDEL